AHVDASRRPVGPGSPVGSPVRTQAEAEGEVGIVGSDEDGAAIAVAATVAAVTLCEGGTRYGEGCREDRRGCEYCASVSPVRHGSDPPEVGGPDDRPANPSRSQTYAAPSSSA